MQLRSIVALALSSCLLVSCGGGSNSSQVVPPPPGPPGNGVVLAAKFDPSSGVVPFPTDLLLSGTTDLTLNIPVANPTDYSDPKVALDALDGFSTVAPWTTTFSMAPDAQSVVGGQSVRVFEVTHSGPGGAVTGVVRELQSPQEFVALITPSDSSGQTLAIVPTKPLKQATSYMAVLTKDITDSSGNPAVPDIPYFLAERHDVLCVDGHSTDPSLDDATACALEPLRVLVNSQETAAASAGVDPGRIVLSWVATTQAITPVLGRLAATVAQSPAPVTHIAPTGETLGDLGAGLPPVADIYIGTIDLPYYLGVPDASDPTAPLTDFWQAAPGAYVPPFDQFGLDPTSTNVTYANPVPVQTSVQTVPLLLTLPNAASGQTRPPGGWPVVIFQHGITRNRTDMFAVAGTLAAQGFAVVAIDIPLHGITDPTNPFYIGNTPFAELGAHERTFDLDLENNATGAAGPDGVIDPSGAYFINLSSLLTSRDNLREGVADLTELAHAIPAMRVSPAGGALNGSRISFVGQSLGSILGTDFLAIDPAVTVGVFNVPGGGIAKLLEASPTFGPRIQAGLEGAGLEPGTADYAAFFVAAQSAIDSADPVNYALQANQTLLHSDRLLLQEVVGSDTSPPDQVIPNSVADAPLSGTEPLIATLGLASITMTTQSADGIRGAVRFTSGEHGSILDPTDFPLVTQEMQGEMASMTASDGTLVLIANPSVIRAQ
ncbi:MAG: Ig-like domain-containing protein [Rhodanobacteraceae bacterium]